MSAWHDRGPTRFPLAPLAILGTMAFLPGVGVAQEHSPDPAVLHVTGRGVVEVEPDRARLSFAVETEAEDARSAASANAELMEAVKTCSLGQITGALYDVGGKYRRNM